MRSFDAVLSKVSAGRSYGLLAGATLLALLCEAAPLEGRLLAVRYAAGMLPPLLVAVYGWMAARRASTPSLRALWRLVIAAHLLVVCGFTLLVARSLASVGGQPTGEFTLPAILLLLYAPVVAASLLRLGAEERPGHARTIGALDTIIFTMSAAVLSWQFILSPNLVESDSLVSAAAAIAYPLGDVLLAFAVVHLITRGAVSRLSVALWLLVSGVVLRIGLDTANILLADSAQAALARSTGAAWSVTFALIGAAAVIDGRQTRQTRERVGDPVVQPGATSEGRLLGAVRLVLPYLAFPTVGVLLYTRLGEAEAPQDLLITLGFASGLVALVMARQFVSLLETRRMSKQLRALSEDLEKQVDERTSELETRAENMALLNYVVTELGYCLTMDEVLARALELAAKSVGSEQGVVWVVRADGSIGVDMAQGLEEEAVAALDPIMTASFVEEVVAPGEPIWLRYGRLIAQAPEAAGTLAEEGGLLLIPVLFRGSVAGAIGLVFEEDLPFSDLDRELARSIGGNLGVALENARSYDEARRLADRDSVTGLLNHRAIHQRLESELSRAQRGGHRLSLVMMDLDEFKLFNDTYGHPVGDRVLRDVAAHLLAGLRSSDILGRYGGDEFLAILPETGTEGAVRLANRIRGRVAENPYLPGDTPVPIRMSFGIATYPDDARQVIDLVACADDNLYTSKEHGGDSVVSGNWSDEEDNKETGLFGVLNSLVTAVDNKDRYTRRHSQQVTEFSLAIAREMGLSEESQRALRVAGLLHDVGKIGVPDRILRKPGGLEGEEVEIIRQHAQLSEMIMKEIPNLFEVQGAVGAHHERFDGQGYPRQLQGDDIPLLGRILAVADSYSAMTSDRPYRKAMTPEEAREELRRVAGAQLDPRIVEVFLRSLTEPVEDELPPRANAAS